MKTLFIAFFVGICCFLSACDVRTRNDQEPITINFYEEVYYIDGEGYVDNIEEDDKAAASKLDPASAEAYWNLETGKLYLEQGELDKAIVKFERAVQANPGFIEAHYLLADVYSLKGEGVLSRKSLEMAMALEGSYIIDTTIGPIDRTHTIIESTPPAVIRSEEIIELFEDLGKIGVPRE